MTDAAETSAPAPALHGRPTPSPIRVDLMHPSDSDIHSNSSPLGAALMQRKVERQTHPELAVNGQRPTDVQPLDSPGWESRMHQLKSDSDLSKSNSSPLGTALMARKVERQNEALDRQLPRVGAAQAPATSGDELQRPPPLGRDS